VSIRTFRIPATATGVDLPTYVVLHGVGLSHRFYGRLGSLLARSGHVVSFDLPGFGSSPRPSERLSVEDYAALIRRELTRLGTGPAVVIGHSMGAQFAIEVARQDPALVSRVVVIGPVVDSAHRTLRAQAIGLLRDAPLEPLDTQLTVLYDYVRCGIPWFLTEARAMREYPTLDRIRDLSQPTLVIRGEHDPIAGEEWCRRLLDGAAGARLVTIPGKRHNVPHSDPPSTAAAVTDFVGAVSGSFPGGVA
jgi:pimeloyl-ACP methyl ester carboxylesterase